jgi:hypothetical protein
MSRRLDPVAGSGYDVIVSAPVPGSAERPTGNGLRDAAAPLLGAAVAAAFIILAGTAIARVDSFSSELAIGLVAAVVPGVISVVVAVRRSRRSSVGGRVRTAKPRGTWWTNPARTRPSARRPQLGRGRRSRTRSTVSRVKAAWWRPRTRHHRRSGRTGRVGPATEHQRLPALGGGCANWCRDACAARLRRWGTRSGPNHLRWPRRL